MNSRSSSVFRPGIIALLATLVACSPMAPTSARRVPTTSDSTVLRITNTTNQPLSVSAWMLIPDSPGGDARHYVGWALPGTSCLAFPDSVVATVTHQVGMQVDTIWTVADSLRLVATPPGSDTATAWTGYFVAGTASHWSVTFPGHDVVPEVGEGC